MAASTTAASHAEHADARSPARPPAMTGSRPRPIRAARKVLGMLNNCAGGWTPWGTVLTGEENFNGYFGGDPPTAPPRPTNHKRYGVHRASRAMPGASSTTASTSTKEPNEPNRFGWIVEIDPYDPASTPVKRTALGRFKHEGATTIVGTGRPRRRLHRRRRALRVSSTSSSATAPTIPATAPPTAPAGRRHAATSRKFVARRQARVAAAASMARAPSLRRTGSQSRPTC